jgi:hypothetical protein
VDKNIFLQVKDQGQPAGDLASKGSGEIRSSPIHATVA